MKRKNGGEILLPEKPQKVHALKQPKSAKKHIFFDNFSEKKSFSENYEKARRIRSSERWISLRKMILKRCPLCQLCGKVAEEIHHIKPVAKFPELAFETTNLVPLCTKCHIKIESAIRRGFETATLFKNRQNITL